MDFFDVIIIGAGPAGLKCAETLGNSDYKVLLLEKNSEIGPKVCAGGLTGKSIEELSLPDNLIEFDYNKINFQINNYKFTVKNEDKIAFTIDRRELGQWQLESIRKFKNIVIRKDSKVSEIEDGYIVVNDKKISYSYLVGADGSNSITKKYLGLEQEEVNVAIQYIIPQNAYKDFEVYFNPKLFSTWYAWIFPHKEYVSIGCGCNPKVLPTKQLVTNFNKWLEQKNIDISDAKYEAFVINYDYKGFQFGNIFLVGDAAGLASGLTGEGIYQALISGEEVGKIILDSNYKPYKINELLKTKKGHNRLMKFLIKSGKFKIIVFYLLALLLKIKIFNSIFIKFFA